MWRLPSGGARVKEEYDDAWSGVGYQPSPSSGGARVKDEFVLVPLSRSGFYGSFKKSSC